MSDRWSDRQDEARAKRESAQRIKAAKAGRDPGQFIAWLRAVQQSPGWRAASHTARSLLLDMVHSGTNGRLTASRRYLMQYGWTSDDTIRRATHELIECGLLHMTRRGRCPNVSACFAVTWLALGPVDGLDAELVREFRRGTYNDPPRAERADQRSRSAKAVMARRRQAEVARAQAAACYTLAPSDGAMSPTRSTVRRCDDSAIAPSDGAMRAVLTPPIAPSDGPYLDLAIRSGVAGKLTPTAKRGSKGVTCTT